MHFIEFDRHLVFSYYRFSDLYTFIGYLKEKGRFLAMLCILIGVRLRSKELMYSFKGNFAIMTRKVSFLPPSLRFTNYNAIHHFFSFCRNPFIRKLRLRLIQILRNTSNANDRV